MNVVNLLVLKKSGDFDGFCGSGESGGYGKSGMFSDNGDSGEIYEW